MPIGIIDPGTVVPGPGPVISPPALRVPPAPLLLLPLRLEYRVVERTERLFTPKAEAGTGTKVLRTRLRAKLEPVELPARSRTELWVRWFPEEDFAEQGIAPVTADEQAELAAFDAAIAGRTWYDVAIPEVAAAWQQLAQRLGPYRALHLLRHRDGAGQADWEARGGRFGLAPRQVTLFAARSDGQLTPLGQGKPLAEGLRYAPDAIVPGSWMTSFDEAVAAGMGMRVADEAKVEAALGASWLIAVGLREGDAASALTELLRDQIANGNFAVLPQDTPTNSAPGAEAAGADPTRDLVTFLAENTDAERGTLRTQSNRACDLLALTLGVDRSVLLDAVHADDAAFEDARAMLIAVGPALLDIAVEKIPSLAGISEHELVDFFAECVAARGVLPVVRFGKNPYGILPIARLAGLEPPADDSANEKKIHEFLQQYSSLYRDAQAARSDALTPVIEPGDADASDKLEAILKQHPVSRRLDVGDPAAQGTKALGCPYVASRAEDPKVYLADLRNKPLVDLPDPVATDVRTPLLYRLARLSIERNLVIAATLGRPELARLVGAKSLGSATLPAETQRKEGVTLRSLTGFAALKVAPAQFSPLLFQTIKIRAGKFSAALRHLEEIASRPNGNGQLRTLLLETVDLFQHRVDAWAAGLAYRKLVARRQGGRTGLAAGYFGMLGKLRPRSTTGASDGFIRAPSPDQATTAAVLRSAYLRHRASGAFEIDLSSRRTRRALKLLDLASRGLSLSEILGLRGERWLHDQRKDSVVSLLREKFPLRNPDNDADVGIRLFDGLAFVESTAPLPGAADVQAVLTKLKAVLADDQDALSDLVMCEAVHQRALGQVEIANAWLQVLSGEPVPGEPTFVRTIRKGQGSSHRVVLALRPEKAAAGASPREQAEPTLAALARSYLGGFDSAQVAVTVGAGGGFEQKTLSFGLAKDLGMTPLDLVIGGASEVKVRARHLLVERWQQDAALVTQLGALPDKELESFLNRERAVRVELETGASPAAAALVASAVELRRLIQRGRRLEPSDLNAAASPAAPLLEAGELVFWQEALAVLRARASAVCQGATVLARELRGEAAITVRYARDWRRGTEAGATEGQVAAAFSSLESSRRRLSALLVRASRYAEPAALKAWTASEIGAAADRVEEELAALVSRMTDKGAQLTKALSATAATPATLADARKAVDAITAALQGALDGEGLPVLPPWKRRDTTTVLVGASSPIATGLGAWAGVREDLARASRVCAGLPALRAFAVSPAATDDEANDPTADPRDEAVAPRTHFFGVFLADPAVFPASDELAGVAVDEWAEQRPSSQQTTGLAVNYDSPQSEPPHCLLLCEPGPRQTGPWTEAQAAELVWETILWMKTRALPSDQRMMPGALLPYANQIAWKGELTQAQPRLPVATLTLPTGVGLFREGEFVRVADPVGGVVKKTGVNQVGFFRDREG